MGEGDKFLREIGGSPAPPKLTRRRHHSVTIFDISGYMDNLDAVSALGALAQKTRLDTYRLLVAHEPEGLAAGEVSRLVGVPQNTMSTHLSVLARAGLVDGDRQSRSIVYRANLERLRELTLYLLMDCCGGNPALCTPLLADLTPCCPPQMEASNACTC